MYKPEKKDFLSPSNHELFIQIFSETLESLVPQEAETHLDLCETALEEVDSFIISHLLNKSTAGFLQQYRFALSAFRTFIMDFSTKPQNKGLHDMIQEADGLWPVSLMLADIAENGTREDEDEWDSYICRFMDIAESGKPEDILAGLFRVDSYIALHKLRDEHGSLKDEDAVLTFERPLTALIWWFSNFFEKHELAVAMAFAYYQNSGAGSLFINSLIDMCTDVDEENTDKDDEESAEEMEQIYEKVNSGLAELSYTLRRNIDVLVNYCLRTPGLDVAFYLPSNQQTHISICDGVLEDRPEEIKALDMRLRYHVLRLLEQEGVIVLATLLEERKEIVLSGMSVQHGRIIPASPSELPEMLNINRQAGYNPLFAALPFSIL